MSFPSVAYEFTMNQLADSFMQNNPEISIRFIKINKAGAEDPYLQRISSNDLPACGEIFWHAAYAKQNALYPLENLPDFQEIEEKVHQQAIYSTLNRENELHVHALYLYLSIPSFLILNPGLLEKAGITPPTIQPSWSSLQQMLQICDRKKTAELQHPYNSSESPEFLSLCAILSGANGTGSFFGFLFRSIHRKHSAKFSVQKVPCLAWNFCDRSRTVAKTCFIKAQNTFLLETSQFYRSAAVELCFCLICLIRGWIIPFLRIRRSEKTADIVHFIQVTVSEFSGKGSNQKHN